MTQADYFTTRIITGKLDYTYVVTKRPDLKEGIDKNLIDNGFGHLIVS